MPSAPARRAAKRSQTLSPTTIAQRVSTPSSAAPRSAVSSASSRAAPGSGRTESTWARYSAAWSRCRSRAAAPRRRGRRSFRSAGESATPTVRYRAWRARCAKQLRSGKRCRSACRPGRTGTRERAARRSRPVCHSSHTSAAELRRAGGPGGSGTPGAPGNARARAGSPRRVACPSARGRPCGQRP